MDIRGEKERDMLSFEVTCLFSISRDAEKLKQITNSTQSPTQGSII